MFDWKNAFNKMPGEISQKVQLSADRKNFKYEKF